MMVFGLATVAGAEDPFQNMGPDLPGNGGGFNTNDGGIVWDNGIADGTNGWAPSAGWDPSGVADDFSLTAGNTTISGMHVEQVDGTFDLGIPDTVIEAMQIRIYEGSVAGINFDTSVPVFQHTYTRASGDLVVSDSGQDIFSRDLLYMDVSGPEVDLGPGDFAVMVNYPGFNVPNSDSFWATSAAVCVGECPAVIGPGGVNSPLINDLAWNLSIPEPASLALLGLGALAMIRRR
jgi:hypothetical protein